jgi:hypothetical protein
LHNIVSVVYKARTFMDFLDTNGLDLEMGERIKRLLRDAETWCRAERGRQTKLAAYLGVAPQRLSAWFRESKKADPKKSPTGEQALALDAFLKYHHGQK